VADIGHSLRVGRWLAVPGAVGPATPYGLATLRETTGRRPGPDRRASTRRASRQAYQGSASLGRSRGRRMAGPTRRRGGRAVSRPPTGSASGTLSGWVDSVDRARTERWADGGSAGRLARRSHARGR